MNQIFAHKCENVHFQRKIKRNINAKRAKCSKKQVDDDKYWPINCKIYRVAQKKPIQIRKEHNYAMARLGLVTSKCLNPPSTFCVTGKTEVYTQGITLHWVTRSETILDVMF